MQKQLGILIMRDENDILREYLTHITQFFERIYVLDGSETTEGRDICKDFSEVVWYKTDKEVFGDTKPTDGIRGYVWDAICEDSESAKYEWVGVLHPDEFWLTNPLPILQTLSEHIDYVSVESLHGFLHTSQRDTWSFDSSKGDSIFEKTHWAMCPGMNEERIFRNKKHYTYNKALHSKTIPVNCRNGYKSDIYLLQCTYRTRDQVLHRIDRNLKTGWQPNDFIMAAYTQDIFFDTLTATPEARQKYPNARSFYDWGWSFATDLKTVPKFQNHPKFNK